MCDILVRKDIELKDIANLNLSRLRAACGKVFKHDIIAGNLPERPNKIPLTKVLYIETLVRKVQERWFALRAAKAHAKMLDHAEKRAQTHLRTKHGANVDMESTRRLLNKSRKRMTSLEMLYRTPLFMDKSWEMPKGEAVEEYINDTHPRIPSLKGKARPYPHSKARRHCCLKGWRAA